LGVEKLSIGYYFLSQDEKAWAFVLSTLERSSYFVFRNMLAFLLPISLGYAPRPTNDKNLKEYGLPPTTEEKKGALFRAVQSARLW